MTTWLRFLLFSLTLTTLVQCQLQQLQTDEYEEIYDDDFVESDTCQCGVFLSKQVGLKEGRRGRPRGPPKGEPVIAYDTDEPSCGLGGVRGCVNKCLDVILMYLPKAGHAICSAVERDVYREKAFLFTKTCGGEWTATTFSAGKEFCCSDGQAYKCSSKI